LFNQKEVLDENNKWYCGHCKDFVCATKALEIWSVPDILVIQLKRFLGSGYYSSKLDANVNYPDILEMQEYVTGPERNQNLQYELYAVSEHSGSLAGGHYTAHAIVREPGKKTGEWCDFNDSCCHQASALDAHNARAYLLFYQRKGADEAAAPTIVATPQPDPDPAPD
jgi:ubiquitin carboxyl-terminal hydrolase 4/11/15